MSRGAFVIGLLVSIALHVSLLRFSMSTSPEQQPEEQKTETASVMETELAKLPEPEPKPVPEPESEPTQEPTPEETMADQPQRQSPPTPEPEPESTPPTEQVAEQPPPPQPEPTESTSQPTPAEQALAESAPPQPDLADLAEPERAESLQSKGDLAGRTDSPQRPPQPELRIDWGDEGKAIESLRAGDMKLAILSGADSRPIITAEVQPGENGWRRTPYQPNPRVRYSNRLRVVDGVPAFRRARRELNLKPGERMVVLVPTRIERMLETTQLSAAFERGLDLEQVRRIGGKFILDDSSLDFEVTRIQRRRSP